MSAISSHTVQYRAVWCSMPWGKKNGGTSNNFEAFETLRVLDTAVPLSLSRTIWNTPYLQDLARLHNNLGFRVVNPRELFA